MWFTLSAVAATWNIPGDYPTIAAAVTSGWLQSGDELVLAPGTHEGASFSSLVNVTDLTLRGSLGTLVVPQQAIGGGGQNVIESGSFDLNLEDLEIDGQTIARGLLVRDASHVTLTDVVVRNGWSLDDGGGALVRSTGVLWTFSASFFDNESTNMGGAIATQSGGTIQGTGLEVQGNLGHRGGCVYVDFDGSYDVANADLTNNSSDDDGGCFYSEGSVIITDSELRQNHAMRKGGAISAPVGVVAISDSTIAENVADNEGGGINSRAPLTVQRTIFKDNLAQKAGAIRFESNDSPSYLDDVAFCGNTTTSDDSHVIRNNSNALVTLNHTLFAFNGGPGQVNETVRNNGQLAMQFGLFYSNTGQYAIDGDSTSALTGVVFASGGLNLQGSPLPGAIVDNAFAPGVSVGGSIDLTTNQVIDPLVIDPGGCHPNVGFPYASEPALHDQVFGFLDHDGTVADISHLGGPNVAEAFWGADVDGDNAYVDVDCDDADPARYPGATEVCDGVDNDCDGQIDEEGGGLVYPDSDGDGYGDQSAAVQSGCLGPGLVADHTDCNDSNGAVNPGQPQDATCDGNDDDCDGQIDEDSMLQDYYPDGDSDGYGDATAAATASCAFVPGRVTDHTDCDDTDPTVAPGEVEVCDGVDNDCTGGVDDGLVSVVSYADTDSDGYGDPDVSVIGCAVPEGYVEDSTDCDDEAGSVHPGAVEQCDAIDHDCTGESDDGIATTTWWPDHDGDGYGDALVPSVSDCASPSPQHVDNDLDCDDNEPDIHPDAQEQCDGVDHDCDGDTTNGLPQLSWYLDVDGDGVGTGAAVLDCGPIPNHVAVDGDCGPGDATVYPGADEICDGQDNDCDMLVDDDDDDVTDPAVWYPDVDQDTWGDDTASVSACIAPAGHVGRTGDCDDTQPDVYPGAPEACADGLDNDCDMLVDDADPDFTTGEIEYGEDSDGDGYGWPIGTELACSGEQSLGWVPMSSGEDCDDAQSGVHPGATEVCNGIDDDCDGANDDGLAFLDYFLDDDGDTFGDPNAPTVNACARPPGRVGNGLDCDDSDPHRHPLVLEVCNGIDDDCNTLPDDGLPAEDYYPDLDGDGFGDEVADPITDCAPVADRVLDHSDCDDDDATIFPGADEDPEDGIDSDCDGADEEIPQPVIDTDGDGIPDPIDNDPNDAGDWTAGPDPSSQKDYGCGCQAQTSGWTVWTGLLRR